MKMRYITIIIILNFILYKVYGTRSKFLLHAFSDSNVVTVGQNVFLFCNLTIPAVQRNISSVSWIAPSGKPISEQCLTYDMTDQNIVAFCNNSNAKETSTYGLRIKQIQWSHRGKWICRFAQNDAQFLLDVQVPARVRRVAVTSLSDTTKGLQGAGTKKDPYDLRDGSGAQLTCMTECGYPKPTIIWNFKSEYRSIGAQLPILEIPREEKLRVKNAQCPQSEGRLSSVWGGGQIQTHLLRTQFVNCSAAGMDGLTMVSCTASGSHYQQASHLSVYFLCPDAVSLTQQATGTSDEDHLQLTLGEIIIVAFGGALAIMLIFGAVNVVKRQLLVEEDLESSSSRHGIVEV